MNLCLRYHLESNVHHYYNDYEVEKVLFIYLFVLWFFFLIVFKDSEKPQEKSAYSNTVL